MMTPLSQIQAAIFDYFKSEPEMATTLWQKIQEPQHQCFLQSAIVSPMTAQWLCSYYDQAQSVPCQRSEFYEDSCIQVLKLSETIPDSCNTCKQIMLILSEIGLAKIELGKVTQATIISIIQDALNQNINRSSLSAEQVLAIILKSCILRKNQLGRFEFDNEPLAAYFAAVEIDDRRDKETQAMLVQRADKDKRWYLVVESVRDTAVC